VNLYEIEDAILDCVDQESGDIVDIEKLEALEMERDAKISNIACWIKDLKAEAEAIKAEKQNLDKRLKADTNKAEQLKNYLDGYLNGAKFKDARCAISYRKSVSTEIAEDLDLNALPDGCKTIKVEANKNAIKEALQNGEVIEGCSLVEKSNIQIR
jgi:hypothetical protein